MGSTVTQFWNVPLHGGDGISEGPETFSIALSQPENAELFSPTVHVVTINDADPPIVSVGDVSVAEGNAGTTAASFTVTLSHEWPSPVSVSYATASGSAYPGTDFASASGPLSFAALETSRTVDVTVNGDTIDEGDETFSLTLSNPSAGAVLGDASAVGTIENDDGPAGDAVVVFAATAGNGRADLEWVYPAGRDTVRIRYNEGPACSAPTDPESEGTWLGGADVSGSAGAPGMAPHESLGNGTQYCYRIWTVLGGNTYAIGATTHARPFDNSAGQPGEPIAWAYATGASSVAAPGLGGNVVLAVSNDNLVHAVVRGSAAGAGLWPSGYVARGLGGPALERPPLVPLPVVPGTTNVALLGSQDGGVYAVDANGGGIKWRTPLGPSGAEAQAAPSAFFAAYGAPFGIDFDVVVVGTRKGGGAGGTLNRFYALDAATGAVLGTPYGDGGVPDIGFVSGSASLDYPTKRAYFTSRSSGSPNTLWCFDVGGGGLSLAWGQPAGEIHASPVLRGGVVYTSTIDGDVMAYRADNGNPLWTVAFPTEAGGVKGYIFPDRLSQRLYFSTTTKVWAIDDGGAASSPGWSSTAASSSPSTPVFGELGGTGYVFVGGSDGKLYQLDAATGTQVKSVQLGGPVDAIGAPTLDVVHSMVYAGSAAGIVYGVKVPLP
jgi:outer membrane protein assembly factor BamB